MSQTEEPIFSNQLSEQMPQLDNVPEQPSSEQTPEQQTPELQMPQTNSVVTTWNGERPFIGAVAFYKQTLDIAVSRAVNLLRMYPQHQYMKVDIPLFSKIVIPCTIHNEVVEKTYMLHDVHYAPRCKTQRHPNETELEYYIRSFKTRYWKIWVDVNMDPTKNPGGDGKGMNNTACSAFRSVQLELMQHRLFLVDMSDFDNNYHGKMRYNIKVRIYREKPPYPAKCWHQYGLLPGLGAIPKTATTSNNEVGNNEVNNNEMDWPPLR